METKLTLAFGRRTHPENVRAIWGARLIFPADLVHDRQDLVAVDDEAKLELIMWLNDERALQKALDNLRSTAWRYDNGLGRGDHDEEAVIYEDEKGKIVGSPQSSHGYLYVCAWMKNHVVESPTS